MIALLAVLWYFFAPAQIGGQTSYVIVNGISMEPKFHKGDLALVRTSDTYNVGDIVVYRHPTIGPVIHRVIGTDGDHFIFKGDNNDFVDPYHPTQSELIGKFWFHIPAIGKSFSKLHNRLVIAGLVALSGLILLLPYAQSPDEQRRSRRKRAPGERREPIMNAQSESGQTLLTVVVAVLLASLILAAVSFTRSSERSVATTAAYQQTGAFSYSAAAPGGVYDASAVSTGDPVFPSVTSKVDFRFEYHLNSDQSSNANGTASLLAEVGDSTGWKRTIELLPPTAFNGNAFIALGTLDLKQVQEIINQYQQTTGVSWPNYTVSIVPHVQLDGTLAGAKLSDSFAPSLQFRLSQQVLQMVSSSGSDAPSTLTPSQSGDATYYTSAPNSLTLMKFRFPVAKVRVVSLLGCVLSLLGCIAFGVMTWLGRRAGEPDQLQARYGSMLIRIDDANFENTARVIDVTSFEDLLRLALRDDRMIMHQVSGVIHRYYVQDDGMIYRYSADELSGRDTDTTKRVKFAVGDLR